MHVIFKRGHPSPDFMVRLRALCDEHEVDLHGFLREEKMFSRYEANKRVLIIHIYIMDDIHRV